MGSSIFNILFFLMIIFSKYIEQVFLSITNFFLLIPDRVLLIVSIFKNFVLLKLFLKIMALCLNHKKKFMLPFLSIKYNYLV